MNAAHGDTGARIGHQRPQARDHAARVSAVLAFLAALLITILTGGTAGDAAGPDLVIAPEQLPSVEQWTPMTVARA